MDDWLTQLQQAHPYFRLPNGDDEERRRLLQFAQDVQSPELRQQMLESLLGTIGSSSSAYGTATDKLKTLINGTPEEIAIDAALQKRYIESMSKSELEKWLKSATEQLKPISMKGYRPSAAASRDLKAPLGNAYEALIFALGGK